MKFDLKPGIYGPMEIPCGQIVGFSSFVMAFELLDIVSLQICKFKRTSTNCHTEPEPLQMFPKHTPPPILKWLPFLTKTDCEIYIKRFFYNHF